MSEANKELIRRFVHRIVDERDFGAVDDLMTGDVVDHNSPPGTAPGAAGMKAALGQYLAAFSDLQIRFEDQIAEGDRVVNRYTNRGTHRGDLFGIPPTGKSATWNTIDVVRVENGRIAERWECEDMFGLLQQLGVIPGGEGAARPSESGGPRVVRESSTASSSPSRDRRKAIAGGFFEEQDSHKGQIPPDLVAPGYRAHIAGQPPMDREAHSQFGVAFYAGFPDIRHTFDDFVAEGDQVAVRFTLRGTHNGVFFGVPPTGRAVAVSAITVLRFADDKVAEIQGVFDQFGLMQQLGVVPTSRAEAA